MSDSKSTDRPNLPEDWTRELKPGEKVHLGTGTRIITEEEKVRAREIVRQGIAGTFPKMVEAGVLSQSEVEAELVRMAAETQDAETRAALTMVKGELDEEQRQN